MTLVARRSLARAAAVLTLLGLAYWAAGLVGGSIPANAAWAPPGQGVTIWIEDNGVHTALVLPKVAAGVDWRDFAPARELADPRYAGYGYLAISWGDHDFFLGTPTWADLRPETLLWAATGSDRTLLHVEHVPRPTENPATRRIVLRPAEYTRLARFILETRAANGGRWPGYDRNDVFYAARGHYSALHTCNSWTGEALRAAGVRVGRWTPIPVAVMGWF